MDSERWRQIEEIFQIATELPVPERESYLAQACAGDLPGRREVEALIDAHERAGEFIEGGPPLDDLGLHERRIGSYELIREIGRGGMGAVFLATRADEEFQQRVAIKLLQPGMDHESIVRRFRNERQILAALHHPNIAALLDGGTTLHGLPYFVMEYVEGQPIVKYCAERGLSIGDRLKLFQAVCGAVHYAHQNLIVHRDIKPGNILVTTDGVPKLLDFGIAKLIPADGPGADLTGRTSQMMTPEYASPEQLRAQPITTATDIYSLGVLLYEMLAGKRPYRMTGRSALEVAHAICQEEPDRPSASAVELKGDLDNIILKAMQKEPQRRYGSVAQLSEDIQRYRDGRPIHAQTPTLTYRAGKFVRRHKAGAAATVLVVLALAGGTVATLWQARVALAQRARAERRFNDVRKLANSFLFEFDDAVRDLPGSTRARSLIVKRALEYLAGLAAESRGDLSLQREMAEAYESVAEIQGNPSFPNLGDLKGALASYGKAIAIREELNRAQPANVEWRRGLAASYGAVSSVLMADGDTAGAVARSGQSVKMYEALADRLSKDAAFQTELAIGNCTHATQLEKEGDLDGALAAYQRATQLTRRILAGDPESLEGKIHLATSIDGVGSLLQQKGDTEGAVKNRGEALAIRAQLAASYPDNAHYRRQLGFAHHNLGLSLAQAGDLAQALQHFHSELGLFEALQAADPHDVQAQRNVSLAQKQIGDTLVRNEDWTAASTCYKAALAIDRSLAASQPESLQAQLDLSLSEGKFGMVSGKLGNRAQALEMLRRGVASQEELVRRDPRRDQLRGFLANSYTRLAQYLSENGDTPGALEYYQKALGSRRESYSQNPGNASNQDALAECYLNLGKAMAADDAARALENDRKAVELLEPLVSADANNAQYRIHLAEASAGAARLYARMARRVEDWNNARMLYARSLQLWLALQHSGRLTAADRHWPAKVQRELAVCDAQLRAASKAASRPAK